MSRTRRWQALIPALLVILLLLSLSVSAAENPHAAVRMQNGEAVLYNPADNSVYKNLSGFQEIPKDSGYYYFFKNTSGVVYNSGKFAAGGKIYFAHENGQLAVGILTQGNKAWYFLKDASMVRNTIVKSADRTFYYAGKNGKLKTGLKKINGAFYYFSPESYQMQFGWVQSGTDTLYMRGAGEQIGQAVTGWLALDGSRYYFNKKGRMVKGWLTLNGKKYYMDKNTGACYTGKRTVDGKEYDFGTTGAITTTINATGPWFIKVNQSTCTVTIYRGSTPIKAFDCSVGLNGATPDGNYRVLDHLRWHELMGPSWGQWCSHISSDILFHSIPYSVNGDKYSMSSYGYNRLGQPASHGCIRLAAINAKYIYDNVPIGTPVTVFHGSAKNDPLGKPASPHVGSWSKSYDPTDPTI
jgi:lipoprotein-anchoring transpeptidase ErfK/SrfK